VGPVFSPTGELPVEVLRSCEQLAMSQTPAQTGAVHKKKRRILIFSWKW
jgi:hypothetical protein